MTLSEALHQAETKLAFTQDEYRQIVKLIHPDHYTPALDRSDRIKAAFTRLNIIYKGAAKIENPILFGKWVVTGPLHAGPFADTYSLEGGNILKIAHTPRDNDLLNADIYAYEKLGLLGVIEPYLPKLMDTFKASGRQVLVLAEAGLNHMPLESFIKTNVTLTFEHAVWMVNRGLSMLAVAHASGLVNGCLIPSNLRYGPLSTESKPAYTETTLHHGLVVVDWSYSVAAGTPVKAIVKDYQDLYPPEVLKKRGTYPSSDIYMLLKSVLGVITKLPFYQACQAMVIPPHFKGLLEKCFADSPFHRLQNAFEVQDRWRQLAEEAYGPPRYVKLVI